VFAGNYFAPNDGRTYDVSADGKRFLMIRELPAPTNSPVKLNVVLNWTQEVKYPRLKLL
jgi:hypothetical protein